MEADDPFASITKLCQVSSSQEEHLRHCRFVGEPEEDPQASGEIDEQLTGIMMITPPDSMSDNDENDNNALKDNEIFHTPPEDTLISSSDDHRDNQRVVIEEEAEGGCTEGEKTVDLGTDTDLGFTEVELTQRSGSANEVIQSELNKIRVLKRELAASERLIESLKKKSKISDNSFRSESPKRCLGESVKKIMKSLEKLNSNKGSPYNHEYKSHQSNQSSEASGDSSSKRKLDFSTDNLGLETEATDRDLRFSEGLERIIRNGEGYRSVGNNGNGEGTSISGRKSKEDIDKYRYTGPSVHNSCEMGRRTRAIRSLPVTICGKGERDARNDYKEITLLDVLRMLARNCDYDHSLETKSILDVAKSRGLSFP